MSAKTKQVKPEDATVTYTFKEVIDRIESKFDCINIKFDRIDTKSNWLTGILFAVLLSVIATLITVILK